MITLFGATGYTGHLIARALDRRGLPFRIAGRSAGKLQALSQSLASRPSTLIADVRTPESLPALFSGARLLINCVGPFTDLGEPVVRLAAAHGAHYLDITNELAYVYRLRQYAKLAQQTGAAIVPACGFEVAIADCAVALLARRFLGSIEEVSVVYYLGGSGMSIGTRLSGLRTFATSWLAYEDGKLKGRAPGSLVKRGAINGRSYGAIYFPSAEVVTIPAHSRVRNVHAWMAISRRSAGLASAIIPTISLLLRTPLGWLAAQIISRITPPPGEAMRAQSRFAIKIELNDSGKRRSQVWSGRDAYGLTGEIAAYAAQEMIRAGYSKAGVLAPAQALGPEGFLEWLKTEQAVVVQEDAA